MLEDYLEDKDISWDKELISEESKPDSNQVLIGQLKNKTYAIFFVKKARWRIVGIKSHNKGDQKNNFESHNIASLADISTSYPSMKTQLKIDSLITEGR